MRRITAIALPLLWASLNLCGFAQNYITNGSFESPATTSGGTTPAGWQLTQVGDGSGSDNYASYEVIATNRPANVGDNVFGFNASSGNTLPGASGSTLSQSFATFANEQYNLFFLFGNLNFAGTSSNQSVRVDVLDGATVVATQTFSDTRNTSTDLSALLVQRTLSFTTAALVGADYTLRFTDVSTGGLLLSDGLLDNIYLQRVAPELNSQAALPFALMSLLGICGATRRRKALFPA